MLTVSEKYALLQVVSRFASVTAPQFNAVRSAVDAFSGVDIADLLSHLVNRELITSAHAVTVRSQLKNGDGNPRPPDGFGQTSEVPAADDSSLPPTVMSLNSPQPALAPGTAPEKGVSYGDYRLLRKIGQGGMCSVFLGYSEKDGSQVAIKILPEALAEKVSYLKRFYREAQSGALLNHPNIVRNLAFGKDPVKGRHYLILEFVDGPTAHSLLEKFQRLSVGDAIHIIMDIARGLEYAHSRNVIHRDIKPSNILLTKSGVAKLSDMGLAKRTDDDTHLTGTRQGFGTPFYMPYEQALNARLADARSDVYALGATLYHLTAGEVPFPGESHIEIVEKKGIGQFQSARALNGEIPQDLDDIINKMMARHPEQRFQTVSELIVALDRTQLAPAVPSFIDEKLAYEDPVVRDRLTSPAQATLPDIRTNGVKRVATAKPKTWYVRYRKNKKWHKAKGSAAQIVKRLGDDRIPLTAEVRRDNDSAYQPLTRVRGFRAAVAKLSRRKKRRAEKLNKNVPHAALQENILDQSHTPQSSSRWVLFGGGFVTICLIVAVLFVLFQILNSV